MVKRVLPPIVAVELYENDVIVKRAGGGSPHKEPPKRGDVREFSRASRQRLAFVASNTSVTFRTLVSLTYPKEYPSDGRQVKRNLRAFLAWMRRNWPGCEYLWFLEFQQRGAPHIHVLTDYPLPSKAAQLTMVRVQVAIRWADICATGDPLHYKAGTRVEKLRSSRGGAHYAVKYAQKMQQKRVPPDYRNCGRFWGHTPRVKPVPLQIRSCTELDVRQILDGWKYAPPDHMPVYRVLYNQSGYFAEYFEGTIAESLETLYNVAEQHQPGNTPLRAPSKKGG